LHFISLNVSPQSFAAGMHPASVVAADLNGDGKKEDWERDLVQEIRDSRGEPVREEKIYRLATNSFLINGGDYQDIVYEQVPAARIQIFPGVLIRDILAEFFERKSPLSPSDFFSPDKPRIELVLPMITQ
jgi:hypothetical protein